MGIDEAEEITTLWRRNVLQLNDAVLALFESLSADDEELKNLILIFYFIIQSQNQKKENKME